jgi:hypothetical protein
MSLMILRKEPSMVAWSGIPHHLQTCSIYYFSAQVMHSVAYICRELLMSFKRSTGEKPQRILFYRYAYLLKFTARVAFETNAFYKS